MYERCKPLWDGDDNGGQGFCGKVYDDEKQHPICPHNPKDQPRDPDPPLPYWPRSYQYLTANLDMCFITSTPRNDREAIDQFTQVAERIAKKDWKPVYLARKENGAPDSTFKMIPVKYDWKKDEWDLNE